MQDETAPKSKKEWLKNVEDYGYLKNITAMLIKKGKSLLLNNRDETWETICKKATGRYFKYEYLADTHKVRVTDNSTKLFIEKALPSIDIYKGKLTLSASVK